MPRLFISHSWRDNVEALAFWRWLLKHGWNTEDIFVDFKSLIAGERWRESLRKANATCEAVVALASPNSLESQECQREINFAEDLGKELIIAIIRDLKPEDPRLARFADRQFVDLSKEPTTYEDSVDHEGREHQVKFNQSALDSIKGRLSHLGIAPGSFAWTPTDPNAGPFPGLSAFSSSDAGIYFGREADIMSGITKLRVMRKRRTPRVMVIQAVSGAGKSSFLRAGLWPRLERDPDFAPLAILRPAQGILRGPDGVGNLLSSWFARHGSSVPGTINSCVAQPHPTALASSLGELLTEATRLATEARRTGAPDARPPAPIIGIDQGEELFAPENAGESDRFVLAIAEVLRSASPDFDPYVIITIRADSVDTIVPRWPALRLETPEAMYLPPLSPSAYRDVILKPAQIYSERVSRLSVEPELVDALVHDATGADALPLLAFTLEKLFHEFGADGNLTYQRYHTMGGIGGSIDRALADAQRRAGAGGSNDNLRRLFVPGLATWDPLAGAAKRIVAKEADLIGGNRASLAPLAAALVEARLLTKSRDSLEVAHEALLRRAPIADWLGERKDALKIRDDVLKEAKDWAEGGKSADGLVRRGERLQGALALIEDEGFANSLSPANEYLAACVKSETAARRRARRGVAAIMGLMMAVIASLIGIIQKEPIRRTLNWWWTIAPYRDEHVTPYVLSASAEKALVPGQTFRECDKDCPEMVVVPAGEFWMGSVDGAGDEDGTQYPRHKVTIARPLAVGKYAVTFAEWNACVNVGWCVEVSDSGAGHGNQPVINVSWFEAKRYAAYLSAVTGKIYRLLSEAEREYATRAGTETAYSWGDDVGRGNANCDGCGSRWDKKQPAPVGSFKPNPFGLFDMHGNLWEWVEDNWHQDYVGSPGDGSVWEGGNASFRTVRGGSWYEPPESTASAHRYRNPPDGRIDDLGFRVARTLN